MITTAQLVRAGLGYSGISKRAASGRLHRRYTGVYAVGQPRLSREGEWMAAILACGPGSCLASLNAAVHMSCGAAESPASTCSRRANDPES